MQEFIQLWTMLRMWNRKERWMWNSDRVSSAKLAYETFFIASEEVPRRQGHLECTCTYERQVFSLFQPIETCYDLQICLACRGRLFQQVCPFYDKHDETHNHIFVCLFSSLVSALIALVRFNVEGLEIFLFLTLHQFQLSMVIPGS